LLPGSSHIYTIKAGVRPQFVLGQSHLRSLVHRNALWSILLATALTESLEERTIHGEALTIETHHQIILLGDRSVTAPENPRGITLSVLVAEVHRHMIPLWRSRPNAPQDQRLTHIKTSTASTRHRLNMPLDPHNEVAPREDYTSKHSAQPMRGQKGYFQERYDNQSIPVGREQQGIVQELSDSREHSLQRRSPQIHQDSEWRTREPAAKELS
jgi:hypothetical protein